MKTIRIGRTEYNLDSLLKLSEKDFKEKYKGVKGVRDIDAVYKEIQSQRPKKVEKVDKPKQTSLDVNK
jgi:hypothetical protein